jgi:hypothetical protein
MNFAETILQATSRGQRGPFPMQNPWFGAFGVIAFAQLLLAFAAVVALVFVAWKVGSYYDALRKKL